jgi:hypothetical protein
MTLIIEKPTGAKLNLKQQPVIQAEADINAYISLVELTDDANGQSGGLETGVKDALKAFALGCASDGIWNAIKASCILAGAKTLQGALVPLVGAAPTSINFAAGTYSGSNYTTGDYDRKTGLKGNASNKYLNSNRADNADPLNSFHMAAYLNTTALGPGNEFLMGGVTTGSNLGSYIFNSSGALRVTLRATATDTFNISGAGGSTGFIGGSRSGAAASDFRVQQTNYTSSQSSTTAATHNNFVFCRSVNGVAASFTNARIAFYSIGEHLPNQGAVTGLELLDTRVSALITAIGAAF